MASLSQKVYIRWAHTNDELPQEHVATDYDDETNPHVHLLAKTDISPCQQAISKKENHLPNPLSSGVYVCVLMEGKQVSGYFATMNPGHLA